MPWDPNVKELSHICLRINKILFFGSVFLCGVDPPVLKLHKNETGQSEYISVVEIPSPPVQSDGEICVESFSSDSGQESEDSCLTVGTEDSSSTTQTGSTVVSEIQSLLHRKEQLERSQRRQERRQQQFQVGVARIIRLRFDMFDPRSYSRKRRRSKYQTILQQNIVSVEMEVKPHYLVADTNCFIDYLPQLQMIAQATLAQNHLYTLMVPLVVLNELDGLTRGQRDALTRPEHAVMVSEAAKCALEFLRSRNNIHPSLAIRCVTTKGTILKSTTFTVEQDGDEDMKNDDRILATCLNLCAARGQSSTNKSEQTVEGHPRKIYRDVVLLTEDRNLRVKALARDMPVREVPNFIQWAGLGLGVGLG